jgi:hypothetical protein
LGDQKHRKCRKTRGNTHRLLNIRNSTRVKVALARNTYQWPKEISGACWDFVVPPCELLQLPKGAIFAACDESCVALQRFDRSAQRICIAPSVMYEATAVRILETDSFKFDMVLAKFDISSTPKFQKKALFTAMLAYMEQSPMQQQQSRRIPLSGNASHWFNPSSD